jgi:hypothetical protein
MIKYFHELTEKEFQVLVEKKYTYEQLKKDYPQPIWCGYPEATSGALGCWSLELLDGRISRKFCKTCGCYIKRTVSPVSQRRYENEILVVKKGLP